MSDKEVPAPRYTLWQAIAVAIGLSQRAIAETRAIAGKVGAVREPVPAKFPVVRAWEDEVHYEGALVTDAGCVWQAQRDTGRRPPHDDWVCLVSAGVAGQDGRSFTIRGTFNEKSTYRMLDTVTLGGAGFVARCDDPGPCPGEGWQMIAAQGKRGQPGEPGSRGERGPPGSSVQELTVDGDGMLVLVNGDGTIVTCDLYPVLAKAKIR